MMAKTQARMIAEEMEEERMAPGSSAVRKLREGKVDADMPMVKEALRAIVGGPPAAISSVAGAAKRMMGNKPRSEDDMSELTREIGRGMNYKKGGKVSSASSRADGCAIKGKTRGRMI
jgi:hypothetical protein